MKDIIPSIPEVAREALILLAGALIATAIVKALPDKYKGLFSFQTN